MKKNLLVAFVIVFFAFSVKAGFDFSLFGGYTTVSMGQMNTEIQKEYDSLTPVPGVTNKMTKLTQGFIVGAETGLSPIPGLSIGPKIEFIGGISGGIDRTAGSDFEKQTYAGSLIPIMGGATFVVSLPELPFSFGAGVHAGYAFSIDSVTLDSKISSLEVNQSAMMYGGGFVGEVDAKINVGLGPIAGGLVVGYRIANIPELKWAADNADFGVTKDEVLKVDGKNMAFDFAGLIVGLNLSFGF